MSSISAKQDLRVERLPVENNDVNEGICSFTLEGIGRLDTHVIVVISAQSGALTVKFAENRNGRQTAPVGSKVKCRLAHSSHSPPTRELLSVPSISSRPHFHTQVFPPGTSPTPPASDIPNLPLGPVLKKDATQKSNPARQRLRLFKCSGLRALDSAWAVVLQDAHGFGTLI